MRQIINWNSNWSFCKEGETAKELVQLPHTWNAKDGQDGGNDYHRCVANYTKAFSKPTLGENEEAWLEFEGVAMTATVSLNGKQLCTHKGGYSTFRVNLTSALEEENELLVQVDNLKNRTVYPQKADFTFYGGIYRDVSLLIVDSAHFALGYYGAPALKVTPLLSQDLKSAAVTLEAWVEGNASTVEFAIDEKTKTAKVENGYAKAEILLENVHLWHGIQDPFLYTAKAKLDNTDEVMVNFGCRTFFVDAQKGFFLNGESYPLCGAARHQDRQGMGNALTTKEHDEDIALLVEMGANTVRLAHYQHAQYFYDLCDKYGLIAWAEIPYITEHMEEANDNAISQMKELVVQNYNHPSIVCWGLSNEITAASPVSENLVETHKQLNDLCHHLDKSRLTTMAHVFMLETSNDLVTLPDIRSYNLYYGWYLGEKEDNDVWFDEFHEKYPNVVIGLAEYGADANPAYQSPNPNKNEWSESYQAIYHEHMLAMWKKRPYIWAMHCWNMFDFGADGRNEGGKPGQNQKGLVTFDRKIKKDAFYIYKAYLCKTPFVHLCGSRYQQRTEPTTEIKVYSNQKTVTLFVDAKEFATISNENDHVFKFNVPITGEHTIEVKSENCTDSMKICKVEKQNESYLKAGTTTTINWFDKDDEVVREGYYSIKDSMGDLKMCKEALAVLEPLQEKARAAYGDVAKNIQMPEAIQKQMDKMTVEASLKQMATFVTPEIVRQINAELNLIKKPLV